MNLISQTPIVERQYIRSLVVKCSMIAGIGIFLTAVILFLTIYSPAGNSYTESHNLLSNLRNTILVRSMLIYGFSFFLIIIGVWAITLLYTHRVAGPLYRLGVIVRDISAGKLGNRAKLRQHDAVQPLADELNRLTEFYLQIMVGARENIEELKKEIEDFSIRNSEQSEEERARAISLITRTRKIVEQFEKVRLES